MSQINRLKPMAQLRAAIAKIEGAEGFTPAKSKNSVPLETHGLPLTLAHNGLHEIVPARAGDHAAACGFALALARVLSRTNGTIFWILEDFCLQETGAPYGPGLAQIGIAPERLVLIHAPRAQDALFAMEESLKAGVGVVIGQLWAVLRSYDLTASRRLALAARAGGVAGLVIASGAQGQGADIASAAMTRLEIASASSVQLSGPGRLGVARLGIPGAAQWQMRVMKARASPMLGAGPSIGDSPQLLRFDAENGLFYPGVVQYALSIDPPAPPSHRPRNAIDAFGAHAKSA